jgi:hypothetical protein
MEILNFPDEVLSVIAAHLKPCIRLTSFSLAHSRLRAAADHATKTQLSLRHTFRWVDPWDHRKNLTSDEWDRQSDPRNIPDRRQKCCNNFAQHWLPQHGQHLTRLDLTNFNLELSHLPPCLKELELHGCPALWHGSNDDEWHHYSYFNSMMFRADVPHALSALTKLDMGLCSCSSETLQQVTAMTNLQHFAFTKTGFVYASCRCAGSEPPVLHPHLDSELFKALTKLTHLELCTYDGRTGTNGVSLCMRRALLVSLLHGWYRLQ